MSKERFWDRLQEHDWEFAHAGMAWITNTVFLAVCAYLALL